MLAGDNGGEDFSPYWDPDSEDYEFCDCPGPPPPPQFVIPPPPPSPSSPLCSGRAEELQFCQMEPVGAEFTQTAFPSLPIIAVCSSIVLVAVLVTSFLLWKHKRKVQNFLPCKSQHQGRCDIASSTGITYDDVLINHHPTRLPNHHHHPLPTDTNTLTPIELLDVKYGNYVQSHADSLTRTNFAMPPPNKDSGGGGRPHHHHHHHHHHHSNGHHKKKDHFNPIYEEVSATSDDNKGNDTHSIDSDIDDSEVETRSVASEDEFAEDELSVAEYPPQESQPCSGTSSLQGSTGGDLYPDIVTGSSERFCSDGSNSDTRALKENFKHLDCEGKSQGQKKLTHSLERNKDGHPSNNFQAKQNYYLNKSMLGPDFTYPEGVIDAGGLVSNSRDAGNTYCGNGLELGQCPSTSEQSSYPIVAGSLNFISPAVLQQQRSVPTSSRSASNSPPPPPYSTSSRLPSGVGGSREVISALYNPHIVSPPTSVMPTSACTTPKPGRIPDSLLQELSFKLPQNNNLVTSTAPMSSRSLPVPPSCRAGGSGVLFTVENPYPPPSTTMSRARSGSVSEFSYHPYQHHALSGGRPPTPPPPENIYASIDDEGPFTIDGSRHRSPFISSGGGRKGSADLRHTFGRASVRPVASKVANSKDKFQGNSASLNRHTDEDSGSYGDIRPIYDSRTACS